MPDAGPQGTLLGELAARLDRHGTIGVDEFLELALYHPTGGFYAGVGGRAGTVSGDFVTSPEVGPLFGVLVARALDRWWDELGRPDPFVVVDAGAGPGTLARTVRAAEPACLTAMTWVLVERSAPQRERHGDRLPLGEPSHALPAVVDGRPTQPGTGPRFASLGEMPAGRFTGVILANELLDNLPFRLLERGTDRWHEVRLGAGPGGDDLVEVLVPAAPDDHARAERWAPRAEPGSRLPVQAEAARWLADALGLLERGRVVIVDYGAESAVMAARPWTEWLRTYRGHERGAGPFLHPGRQDVTCEVAVDQLRRVRAPSLETDQASWLRSLGLDDLVEEGRRRWLERAHIGDLEAVAARSRVGEAEALTDPSGLGAFKVMVWAVA